MKKLLIVLIVILSVTMFFSCSKKEIEAPKEAEPIVLEYWMWDPNFAEQEQAMIDEYMKLNPNVTINLTALDPKSYWTKLAAMAASKQMPDVFNMHPNSVENFLHYGISFWPEPLYL